jgi:thiol:disulfide interchange protein DsbD
MRKLQRPRFSVGRIAACVVALCAAAVLVSGARGRSLGELESFLPPPTVHASEPSQAWILNDYAHAREEANKRQALIFIDFTGYTCTNCRWMEANMFSRSDVDAALSRFVRVRLYTDGDGDVFTQQQKMQQDEFRTVALPFYALVRADGTPVATYAGLTRDPREFLAFLQKGIETNETR